MKLMGSFAAALRIGLASARANVVPMVVLWIAAALTVVLYYESPLMKSVLEPLRNLELNYGWLAAVVNRVVFTGVLPGIFVLSVRSIRPRHPFLKLILQVVWCGLWGVVCDFMYIWVDVVFGAGMDFRTVVVKVLFDQLPWTVLVVMPINAIFYFWLGRNFSVRRMRAEWPRNFWGERVLPMLLVNWCIWIPVSVTVFLFPLPLRVHINGFAASLWTLACLHLGSRQNVAGAISPSALRTSS